MKHYLISVFAQSKEQALNFIKNDQYDEIFEANRFTKRIKELK